MERDLITARHPESKERMLGLGSLSMSNITAAFLQRKRRAMSWITCFSVRQRTEGIRICGVDDI